MTAGSHLPVRHRPEGFELRCSLCATWWPLTPEFWNLHSGLHRCRVCWRAYKRDYERTRNHDSAVRAAKREAGREAYWANRDRNLAAQRSWRERNREAISAYNRAYRERNKAALAVAGAAYYAECRPVILAKKRQRYAEGVVGL